MKVVDLFAGPGGWDQGLTDLGFDGTVVGLELDGDACRTAVAAGHLRVQTDVAAYPPSAFAGFDGLIASPPCQAWSLAGRGEGRKAVDRLLEHVADCVDGWIDPPAELCEADVRADLTLQPLRWAWEMKPRWIACEQVPTVKPMWDAMAEVLWHWGYETATAVLNSADYGVPQVRKRAFLLARSDGPVMWPETTHYDGRRGMSLFASAEPWITMADAIGYGFTDRPSVTITAGSGRSGGPDPLNGGSGAREIVRTARTNGTFVERSGLPEWCYERPATTVVSSFRPDVIAGPGYRKAGDGPRQNAPGSVSLPVDEVGVLQGFARDYPWQGSRSSQYRQCGNAVPPGLAAAVLRNLVTYP